MVWLAGLVAAVVSLSVALALAAPAAGGSRGLVVQLRTEERADAPVAQQVQLYGSSHALVVGIDEYRGGWPRLNNAVADAVAVAQTLRAHGFEVTEAHNLGSDQLRSTLRAFFVKSGASPDARLLLWFAGHGHTVDGEGYLVPADAPLAVNREEFLFKALHMRDFGSLMRLAKAKHVLAVFDSCFAGTIFQARSGAAPAAITRRTTLPVRQFLTSGDAGQTVRDDGSFRKLFTRALRGEERADFNGDGYLTGEELGLFLGQQIEWVTQAAQSPRFGKLHDVDYNRGDVVFRLPAAPAPRVPGPPPAPPAAPPPLPDVSKCETEVEQATRRQQAWKQYGERLSQAWASVTKLARSDTVAPAEKERVLRGFLGDFPQRNPHEAEVSRLIEQAWRYGPAGIEWVTLPAGTFTMGSSAGTTTKSRYTG